jgi:hypothetical protein
VLYSVFIFIVSTFPHPPPSNTKKINILSVHIAKPKRLCYYYRCALKEQYSSISLGIIHQDTTPEQRPAALWKRGRWSDMLILRGKGDLTVSGKFNRELKQEVGEEKKNWGGRRIDYI